MNGAGNDFIIINNMVEHLPETCFPTLARTLCERHLSIGADGLMIVDAPLQGGDYRMLFFNSDGSLGEMCGNGARCICRYGYENGLAGEIQHVETTAGLVIGQRIDKRLYRIRLNDPAHIRLDIPIEANGVCYTGSYMELGDPGIPHAIIPYHDLAHADENELRELGRAIRHCKDFPKGANVNFCELTGEDEIFERTFERVTFTPGALELVRSAHSKGWKVGVVSGGFHEVADKIVAAAGIDFCLANRLEVVDGKLTGKLAADIVTKESKLVQLLDWAVECGVDMAHTVAIGDGANDIPMIQAAGTGIAFCAKPKTREASPFAIDERNLMLAMNIILRD